MAYTTQSIVEKYLGRVLTADEIALFAILLPAVTRWIDQTLSSSFEPAGRTARFYDADGATVDIDPCQDVEYVKAVDSDDSVAYDYTVNTEYLLYPLNTTVKNELVAKSQHGFTHGTRRIKISARFTEAVYNADFSTGTVPEDIQMLATRLIASQLRGLTADSEVDEAGVKKESVEGHSIEYVTSADYLSQLSSTDPITASILSTRRQLLLG